MKLMNSLTRKNKRRTIVLQKLKAQLEIIKSRRGNNKPSIGEWSLVSQIVSIEKKLQGESPKKKDSSGLIKAQKYSPFQDTMEYHKSIAGA